jgi:hypothetical protein
VTTLKIIQTLTAFTATALITAGCGGSTGSEAPTSTSGAPATPSATDAPQLSDQQAPPDRLVIDVTIRGGEVTPTNAQFDSKAKEPIVIRVNSDVADQLHVHSNPSTRSTSNRRTASPSSSRSTCRAKSTSNCTS